MGKLDVRAILTIKTIESRTLRYITNVSSKQFNPIHVVLLSSFLESFKVRLFSCLRT